MRNNPHPPFCCKNGAKREYWVEEALNGDSDDNCPADNISGYLGYNDKEEACLSGGKCLSCHESDWCAA